MLEGKANSVCIHPNRVQARNMNLTSTLFYGTSREGKEEEQFSALVQPFKICFYLRKQQADLIH